MGRRRIDMFVGGITRESLAKEARRKKMLEEIAPAKDTRPSWNTYFLKLAKDVSERSNCCRRKVGAVIVKDNHIIATGYNGTPAGTTNCFDGGCPRCNHTHTTGEKLDECLCVHAEQNAICQAAKHGNAVDGGHIYITCSPCLTCLKLIINAGIKRVVFSEWYKPFNEQELNLIQEAKLEYMECVR
jgi:dCMP deaminase